MLGLRFHLMRFAGDRRGATLVEYAIGFSFIILALLTLVLTVGELAEAAVGADRLLHAGELDRQRVRLD